MKAEKVFRAKGGSIENEDANPEDDSEKYVSPPNYFLEMRKCNDEDPLSMFDQDFHIMTTPEPITFTLLGSELFTHHVQTKQLANSLIICY